MSNPTDSLVDRCVGAAAALAKPESPSPSADAGSAVAWSNPRIAGRIPEVDGLRGLAISLVLVYHYIGSIGAPRFPAWQAVTKSIGLFWSGVDLFFVLSGFLICGILTDSVRSASYFTTFYMRRVHRIFPLYFGWLALFVLGVYFRVDHGWTHHPFDARVPLWMYPVFLQNNAPLLLNADLPLWMAMSWSLALEEQFYLFLPALVRFLRARALAIVSIAVIVLSPLYRLVLVTSLAPLNPGWLFATMSRLDGLAMGVGVALLVRHRPSWEFVGAHRRALGLCVLALFGGLTVLTYGDPRLVTMALCGFTAVSAFYALLLLVCLTDASPRLSRSLTNRVLLHMGKISYAVYIVHQGAHVLVDEVVSQTGMLGSHSHIVRLAVVTVSSLAATILLAESSWHIVESRLIRRAHVKYRY